MSKVRAIVNLIFSSNYIILTDRMSVGSVSPLYSEGFINKLEEEIDRQRLALMRHEQIIEEIAKHE